MTYFDICGTIGKDDFKGIVLCKQDIIVIQEGDLQLVLILFLIDQLQVILCWHLITQIPIGLPATADWETWAESDLNMLVRAESIRAGDVADIVCEVEVLDIPRVLGIDFLDTVISIAILVEVNSVELSLELWTNILHHEELINSNKAKVRDMHRFRCFRQQELRIRLLDQESDLLEGEGWRL